MPETKVVSLRVDPETRDLLQERADREGLSLAAFLYRLAEKAIGPSTHFELWAADIEKVIDLLAEIGETATLLALGPPKLELNIIQMGGDLDELLQAIVEEGGLEEDYEEVDEDEDEDDD